MTVSHDSFCSAFRDLWSRRSARFSQVRQPRRPILVSVHQSPSFDERAPNGRLDPSGTLRYSLSRRLRATSSSRNTLSNTPDMRWSRNRLTISKPLSAGQAQTYHQKEFTASRKMDCTKCGAPSEANDRFCNNCGSALKPSDEHEKARFLNAINGGKLPFFIPFDPLFLGGNPHNPANKFRARPIL